VATTDGEGFAAFAGALARHGRGRLAVAFVLAVGTSLTEGLGLLLIVPLLSLAGISGSSSGLLDELAEHLLAPIGVRPTLGSVLLLFVAVVAVRALCTRERDVLFSLVQYGFVDETRIRLHRSVIGADWSTVASLPRSAVLAALTNDVVRVGSAARAATDIVRSGTLCLAYVTVSLVVSPAATAFAIVIAVAMFAVTMPLIRRSRALGSTLTDSGRRMYGAASDLLDGVKIAKAHAAERAHSDVFTAAVVEQRQAVLAFERARTSSLAVQQIGSASAVALLVWIAVDRLDLAPARILATVLVLSRLLPLLTSALQSTQLLANALPAWASVRGVNARCESAAEPLPLVEPDATATLRSMITLRDVDVRHGALLPLALRSIDVDIRARTTTAIVGASGSGKTTLADVLVGLIPVASGVVSIDGRPLTRDNARAWREHVAYVPQDPFLFPMSIGDNLRWARPGATDEDLWRALAEAAAADFVRALPNGLETVVGDRGSTLSGGERQRIAIARALVRRPELLVLDEATSALDTDIEAVVREAIDRLRGKVTIVVIAHRMSTVERADQVVVLDRGRVIEQGTWDDLSWRPSRAAS
jgi:ATP-binding cassette subfamily C protein